MLEASFTITITAEDLHDHGLMVITKDYLDELASRMEDVYQESMFEYQLGDAVQAIWDEEEHNE